MPSRARPLIRSWSSAKSGSPRSSRAITSPSTMACLAEIQAGGSRNGPKIDRDASCWPRVHSGHRLRRRPFRPGPVRLDLDVDGSSTRRDKVASIGGQVRHLLRQGVPPSGHRRTLTGITYAAAHGRRHPAMGRAGVRHQVQLGVRDPRDEARRDVRHAEHILASPDEECRAGRPAPGALAQVGAARPRIGEIRARAERSVPHRVGVAEHGEVAIEIFLGDPAVLQLRAVAEPRNSMRTERSFAGIDAARRLRPGMVIARNAHGRWPIGRRPAS